MSTQKQCDTLWGKIIHARSRGRCYFGHVGEALEAHHVCFRSQTRDPSIRFDSDFGVCLCRRCHQENPDAPHVNNKAFLELLAHWMYWRDRERWEKIGPIASKPVPVYRDKIDYEAVAAVLRFELDHLPSFFTP